MRVADLLGHLGRPVTFWPELARFLGSIHAAILLQQLIYWRGKTQHNYLYTTTADLESETALTKRQQLKARRLLEGMGILAVVHARLQHELRFTLDVDALEERWGAWVKAGSIRTPKRALYRSAEGRFVARRSALPKNRKRSFGKNRKRSLGNDRKRSFVPSDFHPESSLIPPDPHGVQRRESILAGAAAEPSRRTGVRSPSPALDGGRVERTEEQRKERLLQRRALLDDQARLLRGLSADANAGGK